MAANARSPAILAPVEERVLPPCSCYRLPTNEKSLGCENCDFHPYPRTPFRISHTLSHTIFQTLIGCCER
jgi:hypothetical protein